MTHHLLKRIMFFYTSFSRPFKLYNNFFFSCLRLITSYYLLFVDFLYFVLRPSLIFPYFAHGFEHCYDVFWGDAGLDVMYLVEDESTSFLKDVHEFLHMLLNFSG